jgi:hypothetical protein
MRKNFAIAAAVAVVLVGVPWLIVRCFGWEGVARLLATGP